MEEEQMNYSGQFLGEQNIKVRDLEAKQRIIKDRLLLIGQNLIDFKEQAIEDNLEIKKDIEKLKKDVERMIAFLETASKEFSRFAKKEDLDILAKQMRIFQP
jgi:hypothetical protein